MIRVKNFNATGVAPDGRLYAGDLLAIQDAAAGLADFTQTVDVSALRVGDSGIQLLKNATADARITAALRADGILRGLGGVLPAQLTTTQRNAITAGLRPYGLSIVNSTTNQWEWNKGSDAVPDWQPMGVQGSSSGTLAARPAFGTMTGRFYYATDQAVLYFSDGAAWVRISAPAGTTCLWYGAVAPTGYVLYDGTNLPASTGIYADLYAHLSNSLVTPDTRGRVAVGKGTHADHDVIGDADGLAVGVRRVKHKHTVVQPTVNSHSHGGGSHTHTSTVNRRNFSGTDPGFARMDAVGGVDTGTNSADLNASGAIISAEAPGTSGGTVGPQTGNEPTDGAAYITFCYIAKL